MEKEIYFVVTDIDEGWDRVLDVLYKGYSEEEVRQILIEEYGEERNQSLIIHELTDLLDKNS